MLKLGFIGAGTVGTALAIRLSERGYQVVAVSSRSQSSAQKLAQAVPGCRDVDSNQAVADAAELIFITTPDGAIAQVASAVQWHPGQHVVHCSGADSTDTLEPARKLGAGIGAFHPLQTFASVKQAIDNIAGSTFAVEAEPPLLDTLKEIVESELAAGADICKVVTTTRKFEDNLTILQLISEFPAQRIVAFAMGDLGLTSRILCPLIGGDFTYASISEGKESAPGQITVKDLSQIYGMLPDGK